MNDLFKEWKDNQSFIVDCCKVTEKGEVLWNEVKIIDFLEKLGYRTLWIGDNVKIIQIKDCDIKEVNRQEIKDLILEKLNCREKQKIRMHLIRNNIFFPPELLNNLKEAIPDTVFEDWVCFDFDEGYMTFGPDLKFYTPWTWREKH